MTKRPRKNWPWVTFAIIWVVLYRFLFSIENAFRVLDERFIPWPWQLSWDEFIVSMAIPGALFAVILWLCFRTR